MLYPLHHTCLCIRIHIMLGQEEGDDNPGGMHMEAVKISTLTVCFCIQDINTQECHNDTILLMHLCEANLGDVQHFIEVKWQSTQ